MDVPRLVFQLYDEENGVEEVEPDKEHVFHGDFDEYQLATASTTDVHGESELDQVNTTTTNNDLDKEIERNVFSISDIFSNTYDDEQPPQRSIYDPIGSVGRLPSDNDDDETTEDFNICSISKLQDNYGHNNDDDDDDDVFASERPLPTPSPVKNIVENHQHQLDANDILPSITDIQALDYAVSKDTTREPATHLATADHDLRLPLEPLQDAEDKDDGGGLWFKGHIMPDHNEVSCISSPLLHFSFISLKNSSSHLAYS